VLRVSVFRTLKELLNFYARKTPSTRRVAEQVICNAWFRDFFGRAPKKRTPTLPADLASPLESFNVLGIQAAFLLFHPR
jgi:hypothetical protein